MVLFCQASGLTQLFLDCLTMWTGGMISALFCTVAVLDCLRDDYVYIWWYLFMVRRCDSLPQQNTSLDKQMNIP